MPFTAIGSINAKRIVRRFPLLWLLAPYMLLLVVFIAIPVVNLIVISFYKQSVGTIWTPILTFQNYAHLIRPYYFYLTLRTFEIAAVTTVLCIILGYPVAYFLARCSPKMLSVGLFLLVTPLMVSTVVRAFGWIVILGRNGIINSIAKWFGLGTILDVMYTETAVVIGLVQIVLPLMVMPLMASIEKISRSLEEAAANLGAWPFLVFIKVLFPLSLPGLFSGMLLCFTVSFSVVITPALLGGRKARMFGNEIYDQVIGSLNWPMAASLSVILVLLILIFLIVGLRLGKWLQRRQVL